MGLGEGIDGLEKVAACKKKLAGIGGRASPPGRGPLLAAGQARPGPSPAACEPRRAGASCLAEPRLFRPSCGRLLARAPARGPGFARPAGRGAGAEKPTRLASSGHPPRRGSPARSGPRLASFAAGGAANRPKKNRYGRGGFFFVIKFIFILIYLFFLRGGWIKLYKPYKNVTWLVSFLQRVYKCGSCAHFGREPASEAGGRDGQGLGCAKGQRVFNRPSSF